MSTHAVASFSRSRGRRGVYRVALHVQADPLLPLREAHVLSGRVKGAIRAEIPEVQSVLVHMEPFEPVRR